MYNYIEEVAKVWHQIRQLEKKVVSHRIVDVYPEVVEEARRKAGLQEGDRRAKEKRDAIEEAKTHNGYLTAVGGRAHE